VADAVSGYRLLRTFNPLLPNFSEAALRWGVGDAPVYCFRLSLSARFFIRLFALDEGGSRRRRTVRYATGCGAPIGYTASTAATKTFALTAPQVL